MLLLSLVKVIVELIGLLSALVMSLNWSSSFGCTTPSMQERLNRSLLLFARNQWLVVDRCLSPEFVRSLADSSRPSLLFHYGCSSFTFYSWFLLSELGREKWLQLAFLTLSRSRGWHQQYSSQVTSSSSLPVFSSPSRSSGTLPPSWQPLFSFKSQMQLFS